MDLWSKYISPFILLFITTMNADGFEVWVEATSSAVEFGHPLEVTCNTTCTDPLFNVEHKPGINPKRINGSNWITDQFLKVQKWDFTVPCSVTCPSEKSAIKDDKVVITVYNQDLNISSVPEVLEITRRYQLECTGPRIYPKNKLILTWLRGSEVVQRDSREGKGLPDEDDRLRSVLNITADILDEGQWYTCLAEVDLGFNTTKRITNSSVNLQVYAFPVHPRILNKNPIEVNQEVTLTCEVLNVYPAEKMRVKWILNGEEQEASINRSDPTLDRETTAWTPQQIGPNEVVCIAYLEGYPSVPQKKDNISIEVYMLPGLELQVPASSEGIPVNITCSLSNVTGDFQLRLKMGSDVLVSASDTNTTISYKVIPQAEMNGQQYTCEAELNLQHQFNRTVKQNSAFNVQYKPRNTAILVNNKILSGSLMNISKGDEFTMSCSSDGNPQATMEWYGPYQENKLETNPPEVLHISRATSEHEGIYKCRAVNEHGIVEKEMEIKVIEIKLKDKTWILWLILVCFSVIILVLIVSILVCRAQKKGVYNVLDPRIPNNQEIPNVNEHNNNIPLEALVVNHSNLQADSTNSNGV